MANDWYQDDLNALYTNNGLDNACHPNAPSGGGGGGAFTQAGPWGASYDIFSRLPNPYSPAALTLTSQKITKVAAAQTGKLSLASLPNIMRHNQWTKGAALMDSWFSRQAKIAPNYDAPDTATITMDWILGFKRAAEIYGKLVTDQIWRNQAAQKEIEKMLRRKGFLVSNSCFSRAFGDLSRPVPQQDEDYINQRVLGMSSDLDDLNAALANFVFNVLVAGQVSSEGDANGYKVEISQVGIYIKDSYDFNGEQFLGYWDSVDNSVSMFNPFSGYGVSNKDFRDWRVNNGKGGDFRVFSDLKIITRNPPDIFYIKI